MRICMVSNLYPPYVLGGAELYVQQIAKKLSAKHDISIITTAPFGTDNASVSNLEVKGKETIYRFYPLNLYSAYNYALKPTFIKPIWHLFDVWNPHVYIFVKEVLKREMPEVVHVHNFKGMSASVFSAANDLGIPIIHTVHDYDLICPKTTMLTRTNASCVTPHSLCRIYRWLSKRIALTAVIAPSDFMLKTLSSYGMFPDVPKIMLPLGIEECEPVARVGKGTFDILYVGRLGKHKGVDTLIEAVKGLDLRNARLHIVGQGSDRKRLERVAHDDSRIIIYGFLAPDKLRKLYSIADVAVVPSIYNEPFGLVIPEYFWHGIPVLGSRAGAIPELINDGFNGFLFPPGDVEALKVLLETLSSDSKLLGELNENARRSAAAFDMSVHLRKLEEIYERVALR
ncbi:MAG: glycosyltransferase family 4 protein [Halobacteriota archaeon]